MPNLSFFFSIKCSIKQLSFAKSKIWPLILLLPFQNVNGQVKENTDLNSVDVKTTFNQALQGNTKEKSDTNEQGKAPNSDKLPLWELGLGLGGLHQPYYVGTEQTRTFAFPVPVPIYRGSVFKSDDDGMRAELIKDKRYKLDLSLDFNLAVDSSDVDLRQGMDDIGSLLQIGPSLQFKLGGDEQQEWLLNLPVRANLEFEDGVDDAGYTFAPNLTYFKHFTWRDKPWRAGLAIGPQFGSKDYQNTYYGVAPEFATVERPAFEADSGYSGSRLLLSLRSKDKDRLWVWFLRYENISGASFEDSPLVETNDGLSVGFIYSRFLFKSKQTVGR